MTNDQRMFKKKIDVVNRQSTRISNPPQIMVYYI